MVVCPSVSSAKLVNLTGHLSKQRQGRSVSQTIVFEADDRQPKSPLKHPIFRLRTRCRINVSQLEDEHGF